MKKRIFLAILLCAAVTANAAVIGTSGTVALETAPFPPAADSTIFVFDEQHNVVFVGSQTLNFGVIAPGTRVNSHYVQFDPATPSGTVGTGSITFDGPVVGVVTSTAFLDQDLSADGAGTSDSYFGLTASLGDYPTGADPDARGLGSPEDDLLITLGSNVLIIDSLEIPPLGAGNLDAFRVFTLPGDGDGDGIPDDLDNCTEVDNADQRDTNGDGFGNICDPDLTNDCRVNFPDLNEMRPVFFSNDPDADFNGDGTVNFSDLNIMRDLFFGSPGPSAFGTGDVSCDGTCTELDTNPICDTFSNLGEVRGDTGADVIQTTGFGEKIFRIFVAEDDSSPLDASDLGVRIDLNVAPGTDYDLEAICDNCDGTDGATSSNSGDDSVTLRWAEENVLGIPTGTDSGRFVFIKVTYFDATNCDEWSLTVRGNVIGPTATCSTL